MASSHATQRRESEVEQRRPLLKEPDDPVDEQRDHHLKSTVLLRLLLVVFLVQFAYGHLQAPKLRLIEQGVCREYYHYSSSSSSTDKPTLFLSDDLLDERQCKINAVQSRVTNIRSVSVFVEAIITVLFSIPYGNLADRSGRRRIYALGLLGLALNAVVFYVLGSALQNHLKIDFVIAASIFYGVGGGIPVLLALAVTIGTDISTAKTRSVVLFWLLAAYYLSSAVTFGLVPWTMRIPALPFFITLIASLLAFAVSLKLPDIRRSDLVSDPNIESGAGRHESHPDRHARDGIAARIHKAVAFVRKNGRLVTAVCLIPLQASRNPMFELALPYVSKRYSWSLRNAAILDSVNGAISLLFLIAVLPAVLKILHRFLDRRSGPSSPPSDLLADGIIGIMSAACVCIGSVIAGFATSIAWLITGWVMFSMGCGVRMAIVTIATSLLPDQKTQVAKLNTSVVTIEALAGLTLSPLIWQSWRLGLNAGGRLLGLPWFIVAAFMTLAVIIEAILVFRISHPTELTDDHSHGSDTTS